MQPPGPNTTFVNSTRLDWAELPLRVRAGIENLLRSAVVTAENQPGGFSPGMAAKLSSVDGRRAFVKAVGSPVNPESPDIYRAEAEVMRRLPASVPAP
jgi:hypothetical protein